MGLAVRPRLFLARVPVIVLRHLVPPLPSHKCNGIRRRRVPALMKKSPARTRKSAAHIPAVIEAAPGGALPEFIPPELATLVSRPPQGDQWLHEIKFDGYKTAGRLAGGRVSMLTRRGLDWTAKFAPVAHDLTTLNARAAYISTAKSLCSRKPAYHLCGATASAVGGSVRSDALFRV